MKISIGLRWLSLWLGLWLVVGCGTARQQATPTFPPDPTQPAAPSGLPTDLPLPPSAKFLAQQISLTLQLRFGLTTTHLTWIWSVPGTQSALISFYQTSLPQHGWTHVIMGDVSDGPSLSACGISATGGQIILVVEAATNIMGNDLAGITQTYNAVTGDTLLIVGNIPASDCATLLAP